MKKVVVPVVLVLGVGISIYMWTSAAGDSGDSGVMEMSQEYTCNACKQKFTLSVSEATEMRRARGDIFCPHCGQPSAVKADVKVDMGGPKLDGGDETGETTEQPVEDPKPRRSGGAQKIN